MPLESSTTINELDTSWPLGGDALPTGAPHIRNIKSSLKTQFPGAGGTGYNTPILATETELNDLVGLLSNLQTQINDILALDGVPIGAIVIHVGTLASIPSNYLLCDGTNGTVNLTDKFIMGTNVEGSVGATGGYTDTEVYEHIHTANHSHTVTLQSGGAHTHPISGRAVNNFWSTSSYPEVINGPPAASKTTTSAGDHTHPVYGSTVATGTSAAGASGVNANMPPWYNAAYIVRVI